MEANVAQDRDEKAENRRRHVDKGDGDEGPHIAAISVAYCVGEVYPDEELPFKYDFSLKRPVARD